MITFQELVVLLKYNVNPLMVGQIAPIDKFTNIMWVVDHAPQYCTYCDWSVIKSPDWRAILKRYPAIGKVYCHWENISGFDWTYILIDNPEFRAYCKWKKLTAADWRYLLTQDKSFDQDYLRHTKTI